MGAKSGEGSLEDGKLGGEFGLVSASEGGAVGGAGLGVLGTPVEGCKAHAAAHFGGVYGLNGIIVEASVSKGGRFDDDICGMLIAVLHEVIDLTAI